MSEHQLSVHRRFPWDLNPLIAIFYHDIDVTDGGSASYQLSNNSQIIGLALSYSTDTNSPKSQNFTPEVVLTVTWNEVHPFLLGGGLLQDSKNCTFQVALISDGNITYSMFMYKEMQWGFEAAIGFQKNATVQFNT